MKNIVIAFGLLFCSLNVYANQEPILQATIDLKPSRNRQEGVKQLQPSSFVYLESNIKNIGNYPSEEGAVFIRFTLPPPLASFGKGVSFMTENGVLPSIKPGEDVMIAFKEPQQLPDMGDFLRHDWPKHRYETVAVFQGKEYVIGTDTITFSAHFYLGPNKPLPTPVPGKQ